MQSSDETATSAGSPPNEIGASPCTGSAATTSASTMARISINSVAVGSAIVVGEKPATVRAAGTVGAAVTAREVATDVDGTTLAVRGGGEA
jgi:hypothetical protein